MQNDNGATIAHVIGQAVWLMTQSPAHRGWSVQDIEQMIMPPVLLRQFRIFTDDKGQPQAFAAWAMMSAQAETAMLESLNSGSKSIGDTKNWHSGERPWLVELICPFATPENRMAEKIIHQLSQNFSNGHKLNYLRRDASGRISAEPTTQPENKKLKMN